MYIVLMKETFRHKECFAERIKKLCHRRYPPVEVRSFEGGIRWSPHGDIPLPQVATNRLVGES